MIRGREEGREKGVKLILRAADPKRFIERRAKDEGTRVFIDEKDATVGMWEKLER